MVTICMENLFSALHFESVLKSKESLVDHSWILFFHAFRHSIFWGRSLILLSLSFWDSYNTYIGPLVSYKLIELFSLLLFFYSHEWIISSDLSLSSLILSGSCLQLIPSSEYFRFIYCILECQDLCLVFFNIFCLHYNSHFVYELPQTWLSIFMIGSLNSMSLNYIFVSSGFVSGDFTCSLGHIFLFLHFLWLFALISSH